MKYLIAFLMGMLLCHIKNNVVIAKESTLGITELKELETLKAESRAMTEDLSKVLNKQEKLVSLLNLTKE